MLARTPFHLIDGNRDTVWHLLGKCMERLLTDDQLRSDAEAGLLPRPHHNMPVRKADT